MAFQSCLGFFLRTEQQNSQSQGAACKWAGAVWKLWWSERICLVHTVQSCTPAYEVVCLWRKNCIAKDEKGYWFCENLPKVLIFRDKETLTSPRRRNHLESKKTNKLKIECTIDFHNQFLRWIVTWHQNILRKSWFSLFFLQKCLSHFLKIFSKIGKCLVKICRKYSFPREYLTVLNWKKISSKTSCFFFPSQRVYHMHYSNIYMCIYSLPIFI